MNISRVRVRKGFAGALENNKWSRRRPGLLGRPDAGATFTITAPGGHGYVFVRIVQGLGSSLAIARDVAGVGTTGDTPIWLEYDSDGRLIITALRYKGS